MAKAPTRKPAEPSAPAWMERALGQQTVFNLFTHFLNLPSCVVARPRQPDEEWLQLSQSRQSVEIGHFEAKSRRTAERAAYNRLHLGRLLKTGLPKLGDFHGYHDFFVPILHEGKPEAALVAGPFRGEAPRLETLATHYKALTGRGAPPSHPDFVEYCRIAVETPLLEGAALLAFKETLEGLAAFLGGQLSSQRLHLLCQRHQRGAFSHALPYRAWNFVAVRRHRLSWGHAFHSVLTAWDMAELGLKRAPRLVLAAHLGEGGHARRGEAELLLRDAELQRECFRLAQEHPDTLGGRLDSSGAVFVTSLPENLPAVKARLKLRDLAESLRARLAARFGGSVHLGVGGLDHGPEDLPASFHEAVLALQWAMQQGKPLAFHEDFSGGGGERSGMLLAALESLRDAYGRSDLDAIRLASEQYARAVLTLSGERVDAMRVHLVYALFELMAPVSRRALIPEHEQKRQAAHWEGRLEGAATTYELMALFRELVSSFTALVSNPGRGGRALRLEQARHFVEARYAEPLTLSQAAKEAGFSSSRFSRLFKAAVGTGFAAYLLQVRLDKSAGLLRSSRLPIHQVAQECGFGSASYFIQAFKRAYQQTPQAFRESVNLQ